MKQRVTALRNRYSLQRLSAVRNDAWQVAANGALEAPVPAAAAPPPARVFLPLDHPAIAALRCQHVQEELEDLRWLGCGDTRRLEAALLQQALLLGARVLAPAEDSGGEALLEVRGSGGDRQLALFTGLDRLVAFAGTRAVQACIVAPRTLWAMLQALCVEQAMLDPGHADACLLTRHHLHRLHQNALMPG